MSSRWRGRLAAYLLATLVVGPALVDCRRSHSPTEGEVTPPTPAPATRPPFPPPLPPCALPPGGGSGERCPYELPAFALPVNEAIAIVQNEHPELFDFTKHRGGLSYPAWF